MADGLRESGNISRTGLVLNLGPPSKIRVLQTLSCPQRISTAIEYCMDTDDLAINYIIDGKRESLRKTTIVSKNDVVDSGVEKEGVDIRE